MFMNVVDYAALGLPEDPPARPCLPLVTDGPELEKVRSKLAQRAAATGYGTTSDPDVHLIADGSRIDPTGVEGKVYRFKLADCPARLYIGSRVSTPVDMNATSKDTRQLGVSVKRIVLRSAHSEIEVAHEHPYLADGFYKAEASLRWTNGRGSIPPQFLTCLTGSVEVEVHLAKTEMKYARESQGKAPATPLALVASSRRSDPMVA
jgi:hypothetical protein